MQGDGAHPRRTSTGVCRSASRGLHRRLEVPRPGRALQRLRDSDADLLRPVGTRAAPPLGFISKEDILATWRQLGYPPDARGEELDRDRPVDGTDARRSTPSRDSPWWAPSSGASPASSSARVTWPGCPSSWRTRGASTSLSSRRAAGLSTVFALGILVTVAIVGAISVLAGRMLGAFGGVTNYLVAALLFVVGLELLGAWPFQWSGLPRPETTRRGLAGAFLFGLAFGTALGPCTFAFLAPVMGMTMQTAGDATDLRHAVDAGLCRRPLRRARPGGRQRSAGWRATPRGVNVASASCAARAACWCWPAGCIWSTRRRRSRSPASCSTVPPRAVPSSDVMSEDHDNPGHRSPDVAAEPAGAAAGRSVGTGRRSAEVLASSGHHARAGCRRSRQAPKGVRIVPDALRKVLRRDHEPLQPRLRDVRAAWVAGAARGTCRSHGSSASSTDCRTSDAESLTLAFSGFGEPLVHPAWLEMIAAGARDGSIAWS